MAAESPKWSIDLHFILFRSWWCENFHWPSPLHLL